MCLRLSKVTFYILYTMFQSFKAGDLRQMRVKPINIFIADKLSGMRVSSYIWYIYTASHIA